MVPMRARELRTVQVRKARVYARPTKPTPNRLNRRLAWRRK